MTKISKVMPHAVAVRRTARAAAHGLFRLKPLPQIIRQSLALAFCTQLPAGVMAAAALPAPGVRIPVTALPTGPTTTRVGTVGGRDIFAPQVVSGQFKPYAVNTNANGSVTGTITQTNNAGILQWQRFDIGANATVNVVQPSSTSVLLNKVSSGEWKNSTVIEGALNANGQVYVYNPNGIIFGKNSQVNVNTLVATTLKIDDARFLGGLVAPSTLPAFSADSATQARFSAVVVEGEGAEQARITTTDRGGRILLMAPTVTNNGVLSAPDGQVALVAGGSVYLSSPNDLRMRGLVIEVNNSNLGGTGSAATNETLGKILVERGNATLVGMAVNQMGTVSATTTAELNGSIYLRAREGASRSAADAPALPTVGGSLTLGEKSVTAVTPVLDDKTTTSKVTAFNASLIELSGKTIHLEKDAAVAAKGGEVKVEAKANPSNQSVTLGSDARIYLEAGSRIDVSGTASELPMESNVITVELRGNELADSPLQRDSVVRGQKVQIDIRKGTPLGNVSGYLALVEQTVGQRTAAGGSVKFSSDSDVIVSQGASIDVSGGVVNYRSGSVATTQLVSSGRLVDIGNATPDRIYSGLLPAVAGSRNFEAGYSQGSSAGSVYFNAPNLVLRGDLQGGTTRGSKQRDITATDYPKGAQLIIGADQRLLSSDLSKFLGFSYLGQVDFGGVKTKNIATPAFDEAWDKSNIGHRVLQSTLDIDNAGLARAGFNSVNVYTQGDIAVNDGLTLAPGGEIRMAAQNAINFNANVKTPGGNIEALSATGMLTVGTTKRLDTAGLWINDSSTAPTKVTILPAPPEIVFDGNTVGVKPPVPETFGVDLTSRDAQGNPLAPIVRSGGNISLTAQTVAIGERASFDVSGGAWLPRGGKVSGGSGGSISIVAKPVDNLQPLSAQLQLGDGAGFLGYGLTNGGSLKLAGRNFVIGAPPADALDVGLSERFFRLGGMAKYDVTANGNLTLAAGTTLHPIMENWAANRNTATTPSGRMADSFDITTLPLASAQGARAPSNISLSARAEGVDGAGRLWIQDGASIVTDPGAVVTLKAGRQLTVEGDVVAKGGTIGLQLYQTDASGTYRPERSIWLGAKARLDASGSAERVWTDGTGLSRGEVLDGGRIQMGGEDSNGQFVAAPGYIVAERGSHLNVSGVSTPMTLTNFRSRESRNVASAGGTIDMRAAVGLLFDGSLTAAGGDGSVANGALSISLDRGAVTLPSGAPTALRDLTVMRVAPDSGATTFGAVPSGLRPDQAIAGFEGKGQIFADTA